MAVNLSEQEVEYTREPAETPGIIDPAGENINQAVLNRMAEVIGEDGKELETILHWIKQRGAESPEQIMWEFRHLFNTLSSPRIGESRLKRVYRYVVLDSTVRTARNEMESMEAEI